MNNLPSLRLALVLFVPCAIFLIGLLGMHSLDPASIGVPGLIVLSALSLVGMLCLSAIIYAFKGLHDKNQALGLPEGSVRAVIALMLLIIFSTSSVYLFQAMNDHSQSSFVVSSALIAEAKSSLGERFIAAHPAEEPGKHKILFSLPTPQAASDIAKQMMTMLGTLLTAMSAFYFGSRAAKSGEAQPHDPSQETQEQIEKAKVARDSAAKHLLEKKTAREQAEKKLKEEIQKNDTTDAGKSRQESAQSERDKSVRSETEAQQALSKAEEALQEAEKLSLAVRKLMSRRSSATE